MTRISIEPAGLVRAASALRDVATEHRRSASRLASDGLPSMPPELVGRYAARIRGLAADLDALAGDLVRAGANLDKRARLAEASQAGATTTAVAPIPAAAAAAPGSNPAHPQRGDAAGRRAGHGAGERARRELRRAAVAPGRRGDPAGRRVLAGGAVARGGRARRAAGDGRAHRVGRQEPGLRRPRQRRLLPDPAVDELRARRIRRPAARRRSPATGGSRTPTRRPRGRARRSRRPRAATATPTSPTRPRSARGRRRSSAPPTRTATRSTTTRRATWSSAAHAGAVARRAAARSRSPRASSACARPARTPARACPSTRTRPAPTTRPGARASSPGRSRSPAARCPPATGRRSRTGSRPRRRARRASRSSPPPTRAPATSSPTTGASAPTSARTATSACSPPTVEGGAFEAIEGNYQDAVTHTSRTTGDANVVFIRVNCSGRLRAHRRLRRRGAERARPPARRRRRARSRRARARADDRRTRAAPYTPRRGAGLVARRALILEPGPPASFAVAEPHATLLAPLIAPESHGRARPLDAGGRAPRRVLPARGRRRRAGGAAGPDLPSHAVAARGGHRAPARRGRDSRTTARQRTGDPLDTTRKALTAPATTRSPPLLYAALAVGSVDDRVWVDGGELGLWTGPGPAR